MEYIGFGLAITAGVLLAIFSEQKFQKRLHKIEQAQNKLIDLNRRLDIVIQSEPCVVSQDNKEIKKLATRKFVSAVYINELEHCYYHSTKQAPQAYFSLDSIEITPKKHPRYTEYLQYA